MIDLTTIDYQGKYQNKWEDIPVGEWFMWWNTRNDEGNIIVDRRDKRMVCRKTSSVVYVKYLEINGALFEEEDGDVHMIQVGFRFLTTDIHRVQYG